MSPHSTGSPDSGEADFVGPLPGAPTPPAVPTFPSRASTTSGTSDATDHQGSHRRDACSRNSAPTLTWQKTVRGSFSGLLNVDKPENITFDEAVTARRMMTEKRRKAQARMKLMPGSWSLSAWRSLMVVIVAWTVVVAPLEIAFSWWYSPEWLSAIGTCVDVLFVMDMLLNFNVAFMHHGRLEADHRAIAMHYIRSWFFPDLIINIPWNLLLEGSSGKSRKVAKVLKLPKIFRLTRLFRVAREEAQYFGTAFAILGMVLMAHYCACMWALLLIECDSGSICPDIAEAYFEAFSVGVATLGGADAWTRFVMRGEHAALSGDAEGEGWRKSPFDWHASGVWCEIAASCSCLFGYVALGVLFSTLTKAMERSDSHTRLFHERLWNLSAVVQRHDMDETLLKRARRHYHYLWSCGSDASRAILQDNSLTSDLRRQFAYSFYGGLLSQVPFLGSAHQSFIKQLCSYVEVEVFSPQDHIIVAGEANTELYFIAVGRVAIEVPDTGEVLKVLDEGSFFGEMGLLFPESRRTVDVVGQAPGWLLVVPRSALESLCTDELLEAFRAVALERLQHFSGRGLRLSDVPEGAEFTEDDSDEDLRSSSNSQSDASEASRHSKHSKALRNLGVSSAPLSYASGGKAARQAADDGRRASISAMLTSAAANLGRRVSNASRHVDSKRLSQNSRMSEFSSYPTSSSASFRSGFPDDATLCIDMPVIAASASPPSKSPSIASSADAAAAVAAASATWRSAAPVRRGSNAVGFTSKPQRMSVLTVNPQMHARVNQMRRTPNGPEAAKAALNASLAAERSKGYGKAETSPHQGELEAGSGLVEKLASRVQALVVASLSPLDSRLAALEGRLESMESRLSSKSGTRSTSPHSPMRLVQTWPQDMPLPDVHLPTAVLATQVPLPALPHAVSLPPSSPPNELNVEDAGASVVVTSVELSSGGASSLSPP